MSWLSDLTHSFARMMGTVGTVVYDTRTDWSDVLAMMGAREVLQGVQYPDDDTRRSLYASWLSVFSSDVWHESFDHLMLECVAATPSPSNPKKPLFADIFKAHDPIGRQFPEPVLNLEKRPPLFSSKPRRVEPLPSLPGFVGLRGGPAAEESGLEGGPRRSRLDHRLLQPGSSHVPTSFEGDVHCPSESFLSQLIRKAHSINSEVKPFIVLLVLGQYCLHADAKDAAPSADMKFLEQGFLEQAKLGQLAIVELLYKAQEATGIPAAVLNRKLREECFPSNPEVTISSHRVEVFLKGQEEPMQRTRPWCRAASRHFFMYLNLDTNLPYALRLTALVASDPDHKLWKRPEFARVPAYDKEKLQRWATNFKRDYREGVVEESAKCDTNRSRHDGV
ncbi:hypothetical protein MTO96_014713 [Rhipicephalus appendiculatus]